MRNTSKNIISTRSQGNLKDRNSGGHSVVVVFQRLNEAAQVNFAEDVPKEIEKIGIAEVFPLLLFFNN